MKQKYMVRQVQEALQDQLRIGENRHKAKQAEATHAPAGIFSYRTFETYMKQDRVLPTGQRHNTNAGRWRPPGHMWKPICKTGLTGGAALCKLCGCKAGDLAIQLPERCREDIQRSRKEAARDYGYSKENNADILAFARATGLRRHELAAAKLE